MRHFCGFAFLFLGLTPRMAWETIFSTVVEEWSCSDAVRLMESPDFAAFSIN